MIFVCFVICFRVAELYTGNRVKDDSILHSSKHFKEIRTYFGITAIFTGTNSELTVIQQLKK